MIRPLILLLLCSAADAQFPTGAYNSPNTANQIDQRLTATNNQEQRPQPNSQSNGNAPNQNGDNFSHYQPNFAAPSNTVASGGSTALQFAIRSYSDAGSRTPDGGVCRCPPNVNCGDEDRCSFTFTFIVATPNQKTEVYETTEIRLDANGDLPQSLQSEWGRNFLININGRPSSLDVLVHHRGMTYDDTGRPLSATKLILVDRFHLDLEAVLPSVGGVQSMQASSDYSGQMLSTRMSMSVSLACTGNQIGPDCDLRCNRSTTISNIASCKSESTGYYTICNYSQNQPNQVENCQRCPWGVRDDSHCQDENGGVLYPDKAGVVDDDFRTATIVLSIILFVVVVLLGALVTYLCMKTRRGGKMHEEQLPGHNVRAAEAAVARPLLQQTRYSSDSATPTPAPRHNTPSSSAHNNSIPTGGVQVIPPQPKSALKKTPIAPPAHIGGANSINDSSANNTFDRVPYASRSEVV